MMWLLVIETVSLGIGLFVVFAARMSYTTGYALFASKSSVFVLGIPGSITGISQRNPITPR